VEDTHNKDTRKVEKIRKFRQ